MVFTEKDDQFPDVMRLKLGNLEPRLKLEIILEYIQLLDVCVNEFWRFEIDPIVNPRYQLKEDDNEFYKKLKSQVNFSTYRPSHRQTIKITTGSITFCKSPTHTIIQEVLQNEHIIELHPDVKSNFDPNKSFVILFADENIHKPQVYLTHTNNDALMHQKYCATLSFIPKFNPLQLDDAYQAYLNEYCSNEYSYPEKGIYIFLLDRSGSMSGNRIKKARQALILFLKSLPEDSYFNVISFGSISYMIFSKPILYSKTSLKEAITKVNLMDADLNGTEILFPLIQAYSDTIDGYRKNIFILTDGEVDPEPVIEYVRNHRSASNRVYSLGIGDGCSKYLVEKLAYIGNGSYHFITDREDLNKCVIDLLQDSITPYLENFNYNTSLAKYDSITPNPEAIISINKNQVTVIQVLFPEQQFEEMEYVFQAQDPQTKQVLGYKNSIKLNSSKQNEQFHKIAAHRQITIIEDEIKYKEKQLTGLIVKQQNIGLQDIVKISLTNQILSRATAYICEVKDIADQYKQQKVIEYHEYGYQFNQLRWQAFLQGAYRPPQAPHPPPSQFHQPQIYIPYGCQPQYAPNRISIGYPPFQCPPPITRIDQTIQVCKKEQADKKQQITYEQILEYVSDSEFDVKLLEILPITLPQSLDQTIWITIIGLCYLEIHCQKDRKAWQLIYKKSITYLTRKQINYQDYKAEATKILLDLH